jgi:hypothetical protein
MTNWQPSERASTDEEVLQMVTKATKISNPERTRTKIPGAGTLPRAEKLERTRGLGRGKQDPDLTQRRELTKKNRQRSLVL